jgi:phage shock protein A
MGIFDRLSKVIRSNANAAVDKMSDPSKDVEQLILEMEDALRKARGETTKGMAAEKLSATRLAAGEKKVAEWGRRAEEAVRQGDDALAKEALARQNDAESDLAMARREHAEAAATARAQQEAVKSMESRLREAKMRKGTIKAKVNYGKQGDLAAGALDDFERMAGKVDDSEARLEAEREVAGALDPGTREAETEAKLAKLGGGGVDDRLAELKKKLGK